MPLPSISFRSINWHPSSERLGNSRMTFKLCIYDLRFDFMKDLLLWGSISRLFHLTVKFALFFYLDSLNIGDYCFFPWIYQQNKKFQFFFSFNFIDIQKQVEILQWFCFKFKLIAMSYIDIQFFTIKVLKNQI